MIIPARYGLLLFLSFLLVFPIFGQSKKNTPKKETKEIVAEIKGEKISLKDFDLAFRKNGLPVSKGITDTLAEKKKFLDLLVNYKMKLKDAVERGYDKLPEVLNEIEQYRKSISSGKLVDKEIISNAVKDLYEKRKIELRIAQIFIKADSTKQDFGYSRAQMIFEKIKGGAKFENMVAEYSDDPNSKTNGGDLYYIKWGDISIPGVEEALFATPVGEVCGSIVRTELGFHIIIVNEKGPRIYGHNISHIMTLFSKEQGSAPDSVSALNRIKEAEKELKNGADFASVANKYSDDKLSNKKGGDLGNVFRGRFNREFEEAYLKLKENEVSKIVPAPYGYHIIKVNKVLPYPSLEEEREFLLNTYKQGKYKTDFQNYIMKLRDELGYKLNKSLYDKLSAVKDSFYVGDSVFYKNIAGKFKDSVFVTINGKKIIADSLFSIMVHSEDIIAKRYDNAVLNYAHDKLCTAYLLSEKSSLVFDKDPEFIDLMDDYKNGILLFRINEDEVWSRVKIDSAMVANYWKKHKDEFKTKKMYTYREIYLTTEFHRDSVYNALKNGASFDEMIKKSVRPNSEKPKTFAEGDNELAKAAAGIKKEGDYTEPFEYNGGWSIVRLDKVHPVRVKTFDEARAEVSAVLQEIESRKIEQQYVQKLGAKYKPVTYPERIK